MTSWLWPSWADGVGEETCKVNAGHINTNPTQQPATTLPQRTFPQGPHLAAQGLPEALSAACHCQQQHKVTTTNLAAVLQLHWRWHGPQWNAGLGLRGCPATMHVAEGEAIAGNTHCSVNTRIQPCGRHYSSWSSSQHHCIIIIAWSSHHHCIRHGHIIIA